MSTKDPRKLYPQPPYSGKEQTPPGNEEEMSPKVTGGATVGPQDHEAKDDLAPPAAREGSPLGGVTTIRSFELPGTWYFARNGPLNNFHLFGSGGITSFRI